MKKIVAGLVLVSLAGPALADAVQDRLVAAANASAPLPFTRTTRAEQRSGDKIEAESRVERFDPARSEGQRWTLVSSDGKPPTPKQIKEHAEATAKLPVPGYSRLARWIGARATTTDGRTYRYASLPPGTLVLNGRELSAGATAEVIVNRDGPVPWVERTHIVSAEPFRMMLVAKVERVDGVSIYRLQGGKPVLAETAFEMTGSMMGKSGSMKTTATYSYGAPGR